MGPPLQGAVRRRRVVLLQPARPQVPERDSAEPRGEVRLLEGHRHRQAHPRQHHRRERRRQEGARLLQGPPAQGLQDQLDHARVPPRRRQPARRRVPAPRQVQERLHEAGRLGAVPDLHEVQPSVADGAAARRLRTLGPRRALRRLRRPLLLRAAVEQCYCRQRGRVPAGASAEAPQDPVHLRALRRVRARAGLRRRRAGRGRPRPARRAPVPEPAPRRQRRQRALGADVLAAVRGRRREAQGEPGRMRRDHRPPAGQEAQRIVLRCTAAGEPLASDVHGAGRPEPSHASSVLIDPASTRTMT